MHHAHLFRATLLWGTLLVAPPRPIPEAVGAQYGGDQISLEGIERLFESGQYDSFAVATRHALRTALEARDSALAGHLYVNRARSELIAGHFHTGLATLDTALAFATQLEDTTLRMSALGFRGMALVGLSHHAEALAAQRQRLALALAIGDRRSEAWARTYIGWGLLDSGHSDRAAASFRAAANDFTTIGYRRGALDALLGFANAAESTGDVARSRTTFRRVISVADSIGDLRIGAQTRNRLGTIELSCGDRRRALALFLRSYTVLDSAHYAALATQPLSNCAAVLVELGRRRDATRLYSRALALCDSLGMSNLALEMLDDIAALYLAEERPAAAATMARRLVGSCGATARLRATGALELAYALVARDSAAAALGELHAYLGSDSVTAEIDAEMHALAARAALSAGQPRRAFALARIAEKESRTMPASTEHTRALCSLALAQAALGHQRRAACTLAHTRSIYRRSRLTTPDIAWRATLRSTMYGNLVDAAVVVDSVYATADSLWGHLESIKGIVTPAPAGDAATTHTSLTVLQQSVLRPGELVLNFFVGQRMVWVFAVSRKRVVVRCMDIDATAHRCRALHALLISPPDSIDPRLQDAIRQSLARTATELLGSAQTRARRMARAVPPSGVGRRSRMRRIHRSVPLIGPDRTRPVRTGVGDVHRHPRVGMERQQRTVALHCCGVERRGRDCPQHATSATRTAPGAVTRRGHSPLGP